MLISEGLEILTEDECMALFGSTTVGRVGITIGALPAIFVVNYVLVDGDIVFRTSDGTKLEAALRHAVVAFEADSPTRSTIKVGLSKRSASPTSSTRPT